ncbi:TIGR03857 family LLM class F420-dependent oxidoreductase [Gordonia otitidis]|uniref:TIGR03857 family LLM class F420-dependent oxidoreductase n=1 Tax=Gordonia otitidis TaxID=249058 RepID=UPI001D15CCF8|nr:TIGR03857 family LLM class F420-dependent oxidoreductase [Gordonia otitidis]UEA57975.1 TIGR03857 family LLM class F420-dependent oxidoreductase [Gordonia otitidis]
MLSELGYYALSRHPVAPARLVEEAALAESIGLGTAFVSERFNIKDAAVLSGALGAATKRMGIATAATNHNTRHPIITATMGATLAELTNDRFALGLGRGIAAQWQVLGIDDVTSAQLTDIVDVLRRLWRGEMILGHSGPAGSYPLLNLGAAVDDVPILLVTMSRRTLELAGRIADGVVLHTFLGDAATSEAVATVRASAERAGRDPAAIRIWSVIATVGDELSEEDRLRRLYGRLATYLQGYPDVLMRANQWNTDDLDRIRATTAFSGATGPIDATATAEQLAELAHVIPPHWVADSAVGSAENCAAAVAHQFDLGVDSVVLHGATPSELQPVVSAYRTLRSPDHRELPANPGLMTARGADL